MESAIFNFMAKLTFVEGCNAACSAAFMFQVHWLPVKIVVNMLTRVKFLIVKFLVKGRVVYF